MKDLNKFLLDPDVQRAMDWGKQQNIFSIFGMNEIRHSKMLAWLLDSREGHLQGDYFLKQLLREYLRNNENNDLNGFPVDAYNFSNALVFTEYSVPESNKRIDLAIFDPDEEIAVFIENKTGAKESEGQTQNYFKSLNSRYQKEYTCIFLFIDLYLEDGKAECSEWTSLNYTWLIESINNLLGRQILSNSLEQILSDYKNLLEEFENDDSAFFSDTYEKLAKIANTHKDFLDKAKPHLTNDTSQVMSYFKSDKFEDFFKYIYLQNEIFFDALYQFTEWEFYAEEIQKQLNNTLDFTYRGNYFYFIDEEWLKMNANSDADNFHYFMYIEIRENTENKENKEMFEVKLALRPQYIETDKKNEFEEILKNNDKIDKYKINSYITKTVNSKEIVDATISFFKIASDIYSELKE